MALLICFSLQRGFTGRGPASREPPTFTDPSQRCQSHRKALFWSYLVLWGSFLQDLLWKRSSASFQLIFCENCSTCGFICDVFVGSGGPHSPTLPSWSHPLLNCYFLPVHLTFIPSPKLQTPRNQRSSHRVTEMCLYFILKQSAD